MPLDNNDIKQLIEILQRGLTPENDTNKSVETVRQQKRKKTVKKAEANSSRMTNKFDQMREKGLHKEDVEIDRILSKYPPTARSREFVPIDVVCRVCGRKETVNPALLYDSPNRYKCNKCAREPG